MKLYLSTLLLALSAITFADVQYVGLEVGLSNQILSGDASTFNMNYNNFYANSYNISGRLQVGNIFNQYNSIEVAYNYYSNLNYQMPDKNTLQGTTNSFDGSYILSLPTFVTGLAVFGRVGVGYNWEAITTNPFNTGVQANGVTDVLGAGIKYKFSDNWAWRLEWIADGLIFPISVTTNGQTVGTASIQSAFTGINYYF